MATLEALNIESEHHVARIEKRIKELTGLDLTPMPRTNKNRDILRRDQLGTIADWLERVPSGGDSSSALDKARALIASGKWTKPEMEAALSLDEGGDDGDSDK